MKKLIFSVATLAMITTSCSSDDDSSAVIDNSTVSAAIISGGVDNSYNFCVGDGVEDNVSIVIDDAGTGDNSSFIITDEEGLILGLPETVDDFPDFDGAGVGECFIWHINYADGLEGLEVDALTGDSGENLVGDIAIAGPIVVSRNSCTVEAAVLSGGPYEFSVCDNTMDFATSVTVDDAGVGENSSFIITDEDSNILGLPTTLEDVTGVDFDGASTGICYIWHINYEGDPDTFFDGVADVNTLVGEFALSNNLVVNRTSVLNAGVISGGTDDVYTFTVGDGIADNTTDLSIDDTDAVGTGSTWIVTTGDGEILALPTTIDDVIANDFDGAGAGACLIWYMRYEGALEDVGAIAGANATTDLTGCFDLSNEITVNRLAQ